MFFNLWKRYVVNPSIYGKSICFFFQFLDAICCKSFKLCAFIFARHLPPRYNSHSIHFSVFFMIPLRDILGKLEFDIVSYQVTKQYHGPHELNCAAFVIRHSCGVTLCCSNVKM